MRNEAIRTDPAAARAGARRGARGVLGALTLALVALLAACSVAVESSQSGADAAAEIERALHASTERWNAGDLVGFLAPYGEEATFTSEGTLLRGKAAIEARYRGNYWKSGRPAEALRFGDLEVRMLGPRAALVTGRYLLFDESGAQTGSGPFTLVYQRTDEGWRIVHDHSS